VPTGSAKQPALAILDDAGGVEIGTQRLGKHVMTGHRVLLAAFFMQPHRPSGAAGPQILDLHLVTDQVVPNNPAAAVRGPKHVVKIGKTPVPEGAQWRKLLNAIPTTTLRDLRDRALIATLTYSFARINAALQAENARAGAYSPHTDKKLPSLFTSTHALKAGVPVIGANFEICPEPVRL
jgi:hypothetical protein